MSTLDEIEAAIEQLPPEDFRALQEWMAKRAGGTSKGKWSPAELMAAANRIVKEPDAERAEALKEEIARGFYGARNSRLEN